MKLLKIHDWSLNDFISDDEMPRYAILSHTWEKEEVTFQMWENKDSISITGMQGYEKIIKFGEQAVTSGYGWIWVDTYAEP